MTGEKTDMAHQVVYRQVLPGLVLLGVLLNSLCVLVLTRPRVRSTQVSRYFLVLVVSDLLVCFFYIPIITTINGCTFSSYAETFYFAHFGWSLVVLSHSVGTYTILWLALDRFMAVWTPLLYTKVQKKPNFMLVRMVVTVVACIMIHLVYIVRGEVTCYTNTITWSNATWNTSDGYGCSYQHYNPLVLADNCANNDWVVSSGFQHDYSEYWHKVYRNFYSLMVMCLPSCFMAVFNIGLVVGVMEGRVRLPAATQGEARTNERALVTTMIAMTASYVLLILPITVYLISYAEHLLNRCHCDYTYELFRHLANCLQLLEHVIHIVFLTALNRKFRQELKIILEGKKEDGEQSQREGEDAGVDSHHRSSQP
ncbi:G-protein coupled receptor [Homarus americanus]|uniref:G-protein coupled receptor n=1 Tax=Homarus americanus TaxID=6706 RepID=A0A8J5MLX8_HOMAM|nr:G-protein coupled receptor [Homarus americanus]